LGGQESGLEAQYGARCGRNAPATAAMDRDDAGFATDLPFVPNSSLSKFYDSKLVQPAYLANCDNISGSILVSLAL